MPEWIQIFAATPAYAQASTPVSGSSAFIANFAPFILIFVLFYFLLIRPQQKRQKTHRTMLEELQKGDKIITNGGLMGTVSTVTPQTVTVQIADQVRVKVLRTEVMDLQSNVIEGSGGK